MRSGLTNSLYAQGRFHYSLLLRLPMPLLFMWGERAGEFLLHTVTALFFSSTFITLLLFLCWGRERNSLYAQGRFHGSLLLRLPMPLLFMWEERAGEFLLRTVAALFFSYLLLLHYYFYVGGGRGIRKTLPLPALLPAESLQLL